MSLHYIWMSNDPRLNDQLRRANEARSAAFYEAARGVRHVFAALADATVKAARWIARRHRERVAIRQLYDLDSRILRDIGLPRREIRSVARALADGTFETASLAEIRAQVSESSRREENNAGEAGWKPTVVDGGLGDGGEPETVAADRTALGRQRFGAGRLAGCG